MEGEGETVSLSEPLIQWNPLNSMNFQDIPSIGHAPEIEILNSYVKVHEQLNTLVICLHL